VAQGFDKTGSGILITALVTDQGSLHYSNRETLAFTFDKPLPAGFGL
jgi:hypothetical protein